MTPTQLRIQELWAKKELQPWTIIERYKGVYDTFLWMKDYGGYLDFWILLKDGSYFGETTTRDNFERINIIWKPFDYARLVYLIDGRFDSTIDWILLEFDCNRELYQETVLERPEELNKLILEFLESIYPDKKSSTYA